MTQWWMFNPWYVRKADAAQSLWELLFFFYCSHRSREKTQSMMWKINIPARDSSEADSSLGIWGFHLSAVIFSKRWVGCADKLTVVWAVEPHRDTTVLIWARADGRAKRHETEPNEKWESLLSQSHMSMLEERHWAQKQKHVEEIPTLLKLILFEHDETCKYDFYHIHHFLIIDWLFFKQYFK